MENARHSYSYDNVKMVSEGNIDKYGWEFLFLGADIDTPKEAVRFGISSNHAATIMQVTMELP